MTDDNYITIRGWMVNRLNLKGGKLMVYALLYGFCNENAGGFTGSITYMANSIGLKRRAVHNILAELVEDGLIEHSDGVGHSSSYQVVDVDEWCAKNAQWVCKKCTVGVQKMHTIII